MQNPQSAFSEATAAIQAGAVAELDRLLLDHPALVHERESGGRTLLHVATDWPGHFPDVGASIALLIMRGAAVNAPFTGCNSEGQRLHEETPLHWAASSDDLEALNALLEGGADVEAQGSIIGGGSALSDAVAFGQWRVARRLVERGAQTTPWQAAALGLMDRVEQFFGGEAAADAYQITNAFWSACHGGQLEAAAYLRARGANINWTGHDGLSPLDAAVRGEADAQLLDWLTSQGAVSARSASHRIL